MQDFNNDLTTANANPHQDVDIKFLVAKVIGNWYWYVLSVILFLGLGVLFALFSSPRYEVKEGCWLQVTARREEPLQVPAKQPC